MVNWLTTVWFILLLIIIGYELYAGISGRLPTLTHIICRHVPGPITLGVLIWLLFHFAARYGSETYMHWVRR